MVGCSQSSTTVGAFAPASPSLLSTIRHRQLLKLSPDYRQSGSFRQSGQVTFDLHFFNLPPVQPNPDDKFLRLATLKSAKVVM
jgi:hypothetical protein